MTQQLNQNRKRVEGRQPSLKRGRLELENLNHSALKGDSWIKRVLRGLSQFLAGMYIGEGCSGTPHSESERCDSDESSRKRRP